MREGDRERHELLGLVAGKTKHHSLVAGATSVHAQCDVGRLLVDRGHHRARPGIEAVPCLRISDARDGVTHEHRKVNVRLGGDLAKDRRESGGDHRFTGHTRRGILRE